MGERQVEAFEICHRCALLRMSENCTIVKEKGLPKSREEHYQIHVLEYSERLGAYIVFITVVTVNSEEFFFSGLGFYI